MPFIQDWRTREKGFVLISLIGTHTNDISKFKFAHLEHSLFLYLSSSLSLSLSLSLFIIRDYQKNVSFGFKVEIDKRRYGRLHLVESSIDFYKSHALNTSVLVNPIHTDFYSKSTQRGHHYEITQPISPDRPNVAHECFSRNIKLSWLDCIYGTLRNPRSMCLEKWRFEIESLSLTFSTCNDLDYNALVSRSYCIIYVYITRCHI